MLSRIAENLFWIGRYLERAEDTCRLLDVHIQQLVEDPTTDVEASAAGLLAAMGASTDGTPADQLDERLVLEKLLYDRASSASAVHSLAAARFSARGARETLSVEMWEGINTTFLQATAASFRRRRPAAALKAVREGCATISGIADQTMNHDDGWHFLRLGRSLERVDMTARMLSAAAATDHTLRWADALRACAGQHAFIRVYGGDRIDVAAAEFLLLDRLFPRSVVHCLGVAEEALTALGSGSSRGVIMDRPLRLTGKARAELEYRTAEDLLADLDARMEQLQGTCREITAAVNAKYFEVSAMDQWQRGSM